MERNRFLIFFISMLTFAISIGCNNQEKELEMNQKINFKVNLNDRFISDIITNYADSNKLDSKKYVISLNIKTDTYRTMLYIGHSNTHFEKYSRFPSYYTFVGEHLVLLYSDLNKFIKNESIQNELMRVYEEKELDLENEETLDDNPTWKITKCENHINVMREADDLELPCFLKLGIKGEQIVIEEEEWFKELKKYKTKQ